MPAGSSSDDESEAGNHNANDSEHVEHATSMADPSSTFIRVDYLRSIAQRHDRPRNGAVATPDDAHSPGSMTFGVESVHPSSRLLIN